MPLLVIVPKSADQVTLLSAKSDKLKSGVVLSQAGLAGVVMAGLLSTLTVLVTGVQTPLVAVITVVAFGVAPAITAGVTTPFTAGVAIVALPGVPLDHTVPVTSPVTLPITLPVILVEKKNKSPLEPIFFDYRDNEAYGINWQSQIDTNY